MQACRYSGIDLRLADGDGLEAEAVEQAFEAAAGVAAGCIQDAVSEGGLKDLGFGLAACVGLEIGIGGDKDAGGAGEDPGL